MPSPSSLSIVASNPSVYDGETVELSGQTYLTGSPPRLLIDGKAGINLTGNTSVIQKGFYRLTGVYDADTNTLDVTESVEEVKYLAIEAGRQLGIDLVPVAVEGLIATPPKEIANLLTSYLPVPNPPKDLPIYPYVVYSEDGFYLALSDTPVHLPAEVTLLYQGMDYGFTFSAGEVRGTLLKISLDEIAFGSEWRPDEFGGVIIAESIVAAEPVSATVREISDDPASFAFKRVRIPATYLVTTATVDYSNVKVPFGLGILADSPTELLFDEEGPRLETLDPERRVWQLRNAEIIGTVLYPTEEALAFLDYSDPLTGQQVRERVKPALIVDTLVDDVVAVADISELNPLVGNPQQYWGKVVEFDGYALGANIRLKDVAEAIAETEIPINVNMLAIGIADGLGIGSQLAIVGLNNELLDPGGETILGRFEFRVAVTRVPEELVEIESADTAFFLLSKEELPIEIPTELYTLNVDISPPGAGAVVPHGGTNAFGASVTLTAIPAPGYAFDHWSGDASGTDNPITVTIDSNKSVVAHFKSITYTLSVTVDPSGAGSVVLLPPGGTYAAGTAVALTAVPARGYSFEHWSGDASGTDNVATVTIDSNKGVVAHFKTLLGY